MFDSNCVSLERSGSQIGDTVQVKLNAPAAGTYFIAIAFNAQSLVGQPLPARQPFTMTSQRRACRIRPAGSIS